MKPITPTATWPSRQSKPETGAIQESPLQVRQTGLPGVLLVRPEIHGDSRGFFFESFHRERFAEVGITDEFVQDNHSKSCQYTLRGLHYQLTHPQAKLCRAVQGEVLDVVVDVRLGSPTFGRWVTAVLSAENKQQIYIPPGFAHGFLVLSPTAEFLYKCSDFYYPEDEYGIAWNDPELRIAWNLSHPLLSPKDQKHPALRNVPPERLPVYSAD
jgi:dTDP-4-dehydrorhamnose 3,5-epimerase